MAYLVKAGAAIATLNELATIYLHAAGGAHEDHVVGDVLVCKRREVA